MGLRSAATQGADRRGGVVSNYRTEFPTFDPATMPTLPAGFEDQSWSNDGCPHFTNAAIGLEVWIDYADPKLREIGEPPRFSVNRVDREGMPLGTRPILVTDSWAKVLVLIETWAP